MHAAFRLAVMAASTALIFSIAWWKHEVFVLDCTRAGNTAPACELNIIRRGKSAITRLESGALASASLKQTQVYTNDVTYTDHFYLVVKTARGEFVSSSGSSHATVRDAVEEVNAFIKKASEQRLHVALDNWLMCYGLATMLSLMAIVIIHQLRH